MRKLADCVEALQEVEGVTVEENEVTEQPKADTHPLQAMFMGQEPEMEEVLVLVCSLDGEEVEKPDNRRMNPDEMEELHEDGEEIEIE